MTPGSNDSGKLPAFQIDLDLDLSDAQTLGPIKTAAHICKSSWLAAKAHELISAIIDMHSHVELAILTRDEFTNDVLLVFDVSRKVGFFESLHVRRVARR